MARSHFIKAAEFIDYKKEIELASNSGGNGKTLLLIIQFDSSGTNIYYPQWEVHDHSKRSDDMVVLVTRDFTRAIQRYNEL